MFQLGKLVVRFLLWGFTHAAGIEDHQVSLVHTGLFPAQFFEHSLDTLRIGLIHLAPHRPDMIFPACDIGSRGHRMVSPSINGFYGLRILVLF